MGTGGAGGDTFLQRSRLRPGTPKSKYIRPGQHLSPSYALFSIIVADTISYLFELLYCRRIWYPAPISPSSVF
jgi:hypothetical protein